jgi:ribonucleotide reductase alpha subunit
MINQILLNNGSIQNIKTIPSDVKEIYKTVFELSQKELMYRAAIRGCFIDQSQSLNIHCKTNDPKIVSNIILYGHTLGLKTCIYYLRILPELKPMRNDNVLRSVMNSKIQCTDEICTTCSL